MHNNQPDTRKRIALLIVISILSLIAAPLVPRFNTNTKAASEGQQHNKDHTGNWRGWTIGLHRQ